MERIDKVLKRNGWECEYVDDLFVKATFEGFANCKPVRATYRNQNKYIVIEISGIGKVVEASHCGTAEKIDAAFKLAGIGIDLKYSSDGGITNSEVNNTTDEVNNMSQARGLIEELQVQIHTLKSTLSDLNWRICGLERKSKTTMLIEDVASMTGMSKGHIYKLTCTNQIPYYKPNGKHLYFDKAEIEAWLRRGRVMTNDEAKHEAEKYIVKKSMSKRSKKS